MDSDVKPLVSQVDEEPLCGNAAWVIPLLLLLLLLLIVLLTMVLDCLRPWHHVGPFGSLGDAAMLNEQVIGLYVL